MKVEVVFSPYPPHIVQFFVYADDVVVKGFFTEKEAVAYAKELKKQPILKGWRREID